MQSGIQWQQSYEGWISRYDQKGQRQVSDSVLSCTALVSVLRISHITLDGSRLKSLPGRQSSHTSGLVPAPFTDPFPLSLTYPPRPCHCLFQTRTLPTRGPLLHHHHGRVPPQVASLQRGKGNEARGRHVCVAGHGPQRGAIGRGAGAGHPGVCCGTRHT